MKSTNYLGFILLLTAVMMSGNHASNVSANTNGATVHAWIRSATYFPALTFSPNQLVKINAQGAAVGHAWMPTATSPIFGVSTPIKLGDTAIVKTGVVVMGNSNPYMLVHFTSGASFGKDAYVGPAWIDAVGTPPVVTPPVTPPTTDICSGTIQLQCDWQLSNGKMTLTNCVQK